MEAAMKVMVLRKATKDSEQEVMPGQVFPAEMGKFNEDLLEAGILLAAEGLCPSAQGKRLQFSGRNRTVVAGPFTETKELVVVEPGRAHAGARRDAARTRRHFE